MSTSNLFAQFRRLLPGQPLLVGTVISSGSGLVVVELPGGAQINARGQATVGAQVFVRGGAIEGEAPSLPSGTIEV